MHNEKEFVATFYRQIDLLGLSGDASLSCF